MLGRVKRRLDLVSGKDSIEERIGYLAGIGLVGDLPQDVILPSAMVAALVEAAGGSVYLTLESLNQPVREIYATREGDGVRLSLRKEQ